MKSNSNHIPPVLLDLGDGSWHYNYNIKEVPPSGESSEGKTAFEYETVRIWGKPEYETLAPAVIAEHYSPSKETSLINKYNAFMLGLSSAAEDKEIYEAYLNKVLEIKAVIKNDLQASGRMEAES
jgi:hypothetical protein